MNDSKSIPIDPSSPAKSGISPKLNIPVIIPVIDVYPQSSTNPLTPSSVNVLVYTSDVLPAISGFVANCNVVAPPNETPCTTIVSGLAVTPYLLA